MYFGPKNWKGWSHNLEIFHEENLGVVKKNPRKWKICGGSPSLWIVIFKIYKYLPVSFHALISRHIFELCFLIFHSTRPPNLLQIHCSQIVMIVDYGYTHYTVMSYPKVARKWNWSRIVLKYFLSETVHAQQNGRICTHFAKFLNTKFLKGLTHSALDLHLPQV